MIVRLKLLPDGRTSILPNGPDGRPEFLAAVQSAGAKHDPRLAAYVCERDRTPDVILALRAKRFDVRVDAAMALAVEDALKDAEARRRSAGGTAAAAVRRTAAAGAALYPYQRAGVAWLRQRPRALLADDMGCGKTLQALMAVPRNTGTVVVCPAVVKGVWEAEAARWRPDLTVTVLRGLGSFRWPVPNEIVVLNYELLPAHVIGAHRLRAMDPRFGPPPMGLTVIGDEAHIVRNRDARRTQRFRTLARAALKAGGNIWLLTGTPMLSRPLELYNVLSAAELETDAFGTWSNFVELFRLRRGGYMGKQLVCAGSPDPSVPRLLGRVCLRRTRREVLPQLPPKTEREIVVPDLDDAVAKICDDAIALLREAGIDLTDSTLSVDLTDSREVMQRIAAARSALATAKIPALVALAETYEAASEPLIVFSAHRPPVDVFAEREGWATITGDTSAARRTQIAEDFRAGKYRGLAATIPSAGVGLTLSGGVANACHVAFCDLDWTPALNAQAADRVHRIGQTRGVLVTRLVADHVLDRHVTRLLVEKQALIAATMPTTEAASRA